MPSACLSRQLDAPRTCRQIISASVYFSTRIVALSSHSSFYWLALWNFFMLLLSFIEFNIFLLKVLTGNIFWSNEPKELLAWIVFSSTKQWQGHFINQTSSIFKVKCYFSYFCYFSHCYLFHCFTSLRLYKKLKEYRTGMFSQVLTNQRLDKSKVFILNSLVLMYKNI